GAPAMTGDPDRPPLFFAVPQAMMEAGSEAAIAALSALAARDRDGAGQAVEVSARLAAMMPSFGQPIVLGSGNREIPRAAVRNTIAGVDIPSAWECADGFVLITIAFGVAFGPMTQRLVKWAADEGHVPARLAEVNWILTPADPAGGVTPDDLRTTVNGLRALCLTKKKNEVADAARRLGILASAIFDMRDVAESPQYRGRGLSTPVEIAPGKTIDAPARFAQFSNYLIETRRPAPKLSEHTATVLAEELGFSALEIQALFVHGII
ncbi:MAG TPA: CoA transferase, partial [Candidatus Binataceae bacterium]|nr:CoA transferase [Candidatus Binataceae bacterium]